MSRVIRVGSRESELAQIQAELVIQAIRKDNQGIECELVTMRTAGDRNQQAALAAIGGKGLFVKELEQALIDEKIDIAVHSYKDMPYELNHDLPIVALSKRASPFDALVLPEGQNEPDDSLPIGSSSARRSIQLKQLYAGIEVKPVRGNVGTRLAKLDLGEYSALVLAAAGLNRLGLGDRISRLFTAEEMIPSGSQGIIAVQARADANCSYLSGFHSWESEIVSLAERQYLRSLGSSCTSPVAVYGQLDGEKITLLAMYVDSSGNIFKGRISGDAADAQKIGDSMAEQLLRKAGQ